MDDIKEPDTAADVASAGSAIIYNRQLLAADVADKTGLPRDKALGAVDAVFEAAGYALRDGKEVRIPGFGVFLSSGRPAGKGLDPATGDEVETPEGKSVRFRAGKMLRELVSGTAV